jgi:hypothetical protein
MSAIRKRNGLGVIAVRAHREARSRRLEQQRAERRYAQFGLPESGLRHKIPKYFRVSDAVAPVEAARPDHMTFVCAERLHRAHDIWQFRKTDEAEHPAHHHDACGRHGTIRAGVRGVRVHELDAARNLKGLARTLAVRDEVGIQLDEAHTRLRAPLVICQGPQDVAAVARADADDSDFSGSAAVKTFRKVLSNQNQAFLQRGVFVISIVPFVPVHGERCPFCRWSAATRIVSESQIVPATSALTSIKSGAQV